ncbi:PCMD domain-containing protein [uncultured Alistipes sp.]|uniref:PCMD domain-containing protein n=1 Tax=uncultured Alistipes sp. TaxID=538949 RepID=UPI00261044B8|nr:PCMD domain-containing protein [uncultured Alistipes sp.]
MKHLLKLFFALAVAGSAGCIKNDIPYPVVKLAITSIAGEGFTVKEIDPAQRIVTLTLDETTDIRNVRITQVAYTEGAQASVDLTASSHDMRVPVRLTLTLYQDYGWTIIAEQQINRTFTVAGQIGAPVIDAEKRSATAYVGKDVDRSKIDVTALRLEPEVYENGVNTTTYSPTLEQLSGSSFETVRVVDVSCHGRTEKWLLYVLPTDRSVALEAADAWSRVIWLYGSGVEGQKMGFRYRLAGGEWQEVPDVTVKGGSFTARLAAEPETTYELLAYCGDEQTDPVSVTTDPEQALENGGFENWCTLDGIVYPYADGASPYWGTGNKGSKIANATLTDKGDPRPGSSGQYSADLRSQFANIFGIGKFAAGNLFTGEYVMNAGMNGIITFGRPFTLRPTKLRIWVRYNRGVIDRVKSYPAGTEIKIGDNDNGHIYIALGTWSAEEYGKDSTGEQRGSSASPICIDTRDVSTFFKSDGKDVIGYGEHVFKESVEEWTQITVPIEYRTTGTRPTHLMIVCSASRWGDYFTGSTQSEMWLDDFELLYD